jgi:type VI secretion system protein ImpJ
MGNFVQWHEGMLLSPHHFQQTDNHIQHLFGLFGSSSYAFCYGVHELKIDTSSLASGVIRVLKVRGIFQDGYCFDFDAVHDQPLEKNLSEYFLTHSIATKIYLAIPARRSGTNELSGDMARYYSDEVENISDENTGENHINIPILKPKLRLLLENEVDARYVSFPIFEAEKSVDGGVVGTKFIPPYITIDEHSKISELCREIAQIIRNKVSYFSDRKENYKRSVTDESMASLRLLIQAALPLEAIIKINGIQPFEIYKYLLNAISKIISINPTQLIPKMPVYNHNDLFLTFDGLLQYAKNVLNSLKQQYEIILFDKDGQTFKLQMKKEWLGKDELAIGVMKTFASSEDDILNWINGVQIASESMLPMLRERRILGAERSIMERGAYITQPNGMKILSVKTKSAYIKPMEKLCLTNASLHIIPEEVVLYADC